MHRRHRKRKSLLYWFSIILAGVLIIVAFIVAPSLLLPPPARSAPAVGPVQRVVAQGSPVPITGERGWTADGQPAPVAYGREEEAWGKDPAERTSDTGGARPRKKPASSSPDGTPEHDASANANVRWVR
jgi:hypothetical protein